MKKFTPLIFLLIPFISFAQINFGSTTAAALGGAVTATAKDWEAIEINPANLGWKSNQPFCLGIAGIALGLQDNGISYSELSQFEHHSFDSITAPERQQIYNAATAPGGMNINATITWAALSFSIPKIGGFGISLTDEIFFHAQFNQGAANAVINLLNSDTAEVIALIKQDPNIFANSPTSLLSGSNVGGYHFRELNIDYGRKILTIKTRSGGIGGASYQSSEYQDSAKASNNVTYPIIIYGGIGVKPIWGLGDYNSAITGSENVEEGSYVYDDPNYTKQILSNTFTASGHGYGVDLGLSASYKKWKLGVSAIDLGKITWQNNRFVNTAVQFPAADSATSILANNSKVLQYFTARGTGPNYTTQLPSRFRSGISYQPLRGWDLSADFVAPLNKVEGNLLAPYIAFGTHIRIAHAMSVSIGFANEKGFPNAVPVGVFLSLLGNFQVFAATDDLLAYLNPGDAGRVISAEAGIKLFGF